MNLRFGEMQENIPHSWLKKKPQKLILRYNLKN
jgi:hypothetical protein